MKQINVAIAVIHFGETYLLGYRNAEQHQGDKYEFIGGKVEKGETARFALIREMNEEIGLNLNNNVQISPLGVLRHDYKDLTNDAHSRTVCLHGFRVQLDKANFDAFSKLELGCEGQALLWVSKDDLVANHYELPEANQTILEWLKISDIITITKDLEGPFKSQSDNNASNIKVTNYSKLQNIWLKFYTDNLMLNSTVYIRFKQIDIDQQSSTLLRLTQLRPDLKLILSRNLSLTLQQKKLLPVQVVAQHLTQVDIETIKYNNDENLATSVAIESDISQFALNLPITVSCHELDSLNKLNELARYRIKHKLTPIVGVFISPVNSTQTHPERKALGWKGFRELATYAEVPVIALGGMTPLDLNTVRRNNGDKVAGIKSFLK